MNQNDSKTRDMPTAEREVKAEKGWEHQERESHTGRGFVPEGLNPHRGHQQQDAQPHAAPEPGGRQQQMGQRHAEKKPMTEQASHQGGGQVRSDHKPQGPGAGHDAGITRK
jgi:hypothetical protein